MTRRVVLLIPFVLSLGVASTNTLPRPVARCADVPDSVTLRSRVSKWVQEMPVILSGVATEVGVILADSSIRHVQDTTVDGPIGARVATARWWKGPRADTILVAWQTSRHVVTSEVFSLTAGQRYVLFLSRRGQHYWSWGCGGSSGGVRADTIMSLLDSLSR